MAFYKTSKCENFSHLINRVPITTMRCHPAKHGNLVWKWKSGINSLNKRDFYCHFKKDFLKKEEIYVINLSVTDYGLLNIKKWPIQFCKMVDETLKTIVWKIFYFFPCQKYNGTPSFDLKKLLHITLTTKHFWERVADWLLLLVDDFAVNKSPSIFDCCSIATLFRDGFLSNNQKVRRHILLFSLMCLWSLHLLLRDIADRLHSKIKQFISHIF